MIYSNKLDFNDKLIIASQKGLYDEVQRIAKNEMDNYLDSSKHEIILYAFEKAMKNDDTATAFFIIGSFFIKIIDKDLSLLEKMVIITVNYKCSRIFRTFHSFCPLKLIIQTIIDQVERNEIDCEKDKLELVYYIKTYKNVDNKLYDLCGSDDDFFLKVIEMCNEYYHDNYKCVPLPYLDELVNTIKYKPGGEGYYEARSDFYDLIQKI